MKRTRRFGIGSGRNLKFLLLGLVALFATAFGIVAYATDMLGAQTPPKNIVVVRIDATTFQDLNMQWPFPRKADGRVISRIAAQHPAAIAFDVQLSEPSALGQNDDIALLTDVSNYPHKVVFSDTEPDTNGNVVFVGSGQGTALLKSIGARAGEGSFPNENAGAVIRSTDYAISHLPTLAVATVETATHKRVHPFKGERWIDFRGPSNSYP